MTEVTKEALYLCMTLQDSSQIPISDRWEMAGFCLQMRSCAAESRLLMDEENKSEESKYEEYEKNWESAGVHGRDGGDFDDGADNRHLPDRNHGESGGGSA